MRNIYKDVDANTGISMLLREVMCIMAVACYLLPEIATRIRAFPLNSRLKFRGERYISSGSAQEVADR